MTLYPYSNNSVSSSFQESHDPNRFHKLFTMLLNNPLNGDGGSQGDSNRLLLLRKTLGQQEWRLANVNHSLMEYLLPHLSHPFQNVREKIGRYVKFFLLLIVFKKVSSSFSISISDGDLLDRALLI